MSYEAWIAIAIGCFCIAVISLIITIIMFITYDIRNIKKELSGKQVENYMQEYRQKKEERKRVGIYDPSGKLIDVKTSSGNIGSLSSSLQTNKSMGDALAKSRASASIKSEFSTQILSPSPHRRKDFIIIKDFVFTESPEYIG